MPLDMASIGMSCLWTHLRYRLALLQIFIINERRNAISNVLTFFIPQQVVDSDNLVKLDNTSAEAHWTPGKTTIRVTPEVISKRLYPWR